MSPSKNTVTSVLHSRERFGASLCRAAFHGVIWFAFCNGDWRSLDKGYAAGKK